jgi:hypothetical protein
MRRKWERFEIGCDEFYSKALTARLGRNLAGAGERKEAQDRADCPRSTRRDRCSDHRLPASFQLLILSFGVLQNGNVGVCVFPECEEILVGFARIRRVAAKGSGARQPQVCERI